MSIILDDLPVDTVETQNSPEFSTPPSAGAGSRFYARVKLMGEWFVSLCLLFITAPLMLILAILIKLTSPGPVFYAQTRLGRDGKHFRIFKLRTMCSGAEANSGAVWASKADHRITPVGRILRATHLDELPQLWNVIRGEMSLIGPRPERPEIAAKITRLVPDFPLRLAVRPGITGLAQLLLPADDPEDAGFHCVRRKLQHDLIYISQMSFPTDVRIAIATPCYFLAVAAGALRQIVLRRYARPV